MAYELRDGSGNIFKNKFKEDGDSKPSYKGEAMWRGEKIEVALWVKEGQGGKFFSMKIQEPREKPTQDRVPDPAPQRAAPIKKRTEEELNDEIPF